MGCRVTDYIVCSPHPLWYLCFFRRVKENDNPCASCASGCELKDMMDKKRKECSSKKKRQRKIAADSLVVSKFVLPLQPQTRNKVPWMSGLVSGLQNRVRRFESARNLEYYFKSLESQVLSRDFSLLDSNLGTNKFILSTLLQQKILGSKLQN